METCKKCGKTGKNKMKDGLCKSCRMKVWTCKKCGNPYKSIYERDVCIECEQKATNIVCNVCGRSFKTKRSLANHSRYHDSEYANMMSDKQKGRVFSEETRKKMSESARGRKDSDETKAKKSQVMRDRWSDEDYRRRYHENNAGKKLSESTKAILSDIRKKAWQTEEYRQHQSDALEKLGVSNVFQLQYVKDKIKDKQIERYGGIGYGSDVIREKILLAKRLKRYESLGYAADSISILEDSDKMKSIVGTSTIDIDWLADKLHVWSIDAYRSLERFGMSDQVDKSSMRSTNERKWLKLFIKNGFQFEQQGHPYDGRLRCDFLNEDCKFGVEIDPTYTHSTYGESFFRNVDEDYHYYRSRMAEKNGYEIFHVWDWLDKGKALSLMRSKLHMDENRVSARRCELVSLSVKDANAFFNAYHLQNGLRNGQSKCYGLVYEDALVAAMSFGKPRFNNKYEWECLRYCSKDNWQVYGAMSRLQKAFIEDVKPKSVISYTDFSKSNAGGSEAIGRHLVGYTGPSLIWYDFSSMYRDTLVRAKGANAILGTKYGSREDTGLDNHDIMLAEGFYGVYDCGSKVYELQL